MTDNRMKETFDMIRAEDELKYHIKEFLAEKTGQYGKHSGKISMFPYRKLAVAMACLLFALMGGKGYSAYFTPAFAISVDINPSIELGINQFDKVISVKAYNEDGNAVVNSVNIYHKNYRDAMRTILTDKSMEQYLTPDQAIAITMSGTTEERSNQMLADLENCTAGTVNVYCSSCTSDEMAAAHAAEMSFGKYRAFLELQTLEPEITVDEIRGLSMCQIQDRIGALSGNRESESGHGHRHGNGTGNGAGNETGTGTGNGTGNGTGDGTGTGTGNGTGDGTGTGTGNGTGNQAGHGHGHGAHMGAE